MKRALQTFAIALLIASPLAAQDALSIDSEGRIWVTIHGSEPRLLEATISPVGSIQAYAFSEAPVGWLICNGDLIDKSINPEHGTLVDLLRNEAGSNTNHPYYHPDPDKAYLPDLVGRFARGLDTSVPQPGQEYRDPGVGPTPSEADRRLGRDGTTEVGAVMGSVQADAFQGHWHQLEYGASDGGQSRWGVNGADHNNQNLHDTEGSSDRPTGLVPWWTAATIQEDFVNGRPRVSSETRPQNVAVNHIIKY